ncbi:hypothetical protein ACA910_016843 [Epithemia clementina (nom. ined.)]
MPLHTNYRKKRTPSIVLSSRINNNSQTISNDNNNNAKPSPRLNFSQENRRRRCHVPPPARLAWPGLSSSQSSSQQSNHSANSQPTLSQENEGGSSSFHSQSLVQRAENKKVASRSFASSSSPFNCRKRGREDKATTTCVNRSSVSAHKQQNDLWIDKHRPTKSSDLVVAPKKVKQVATWLKQQVDVNENNSQQQPHSYKLGCGGERLLILVGGPGTGKSTLIHVLAQELGWDVMEWTESFYEFIAERSEMDLQTPLQQFQQFLRQNSIGYASLAMESDNDNNQELKAPTRTTSKRRILKAATANDLPSTNNNQKRLIVLDELPYCHTAESQSALRESLTQHILTSIVPTVWIWSHNVLEGKHNPADLEALVDADVLYNTNLVTFVPIHAATIKRFQSILTRIAQIENMTATSPLSSNWINELHTQSRGDVRFAIHALQYQYGGSGVQEALSTIHSQQQRTNKKPAKDRGSLGGSSKPIAADRDVRLSAFHALGKALYAKRKQRTEGNDINDSKTAKKEALLDFNPEGAMEHSGMELGGSLHFLQYHSLDFFTDVSELSVAWDLYSDAAIFLDCDRDGLGASSLAGRAVAYANHHPAPSKFRQFTKPKSFHAMAQRKANQWRLDQYYRASTTTASSVVASRHSRNTFATDLYPYGRILQNQQQKSRYYNGSFDGDEDALSQSSFWEGPILQSFVAGSANAGQETSATAHDIAWRQEQDDLLREDDIADFED